MGISHVHFIRSCHGNGAWLFEKEREAPNTIKQLSINLRQLSHVIYYNGSRCGSAWVLAGDELPISITWQPYASFWHTVFPHVFWLFLFTCMYIVRWHIIFLFQQIQMYFWTWEMIKTNNDFNSTKIDDIIIHTRWLNSTKILFL